MEPTVRLYHGTNSAAVASIRRDGAFREADHAAIAHAIEDRYRLPRNSVYDHPNYSFNKDFRRGDRKVYFTGDLWVAQEHARIGSEAVGDALGSAWQILHAAEIEALDGDFPPGRMDWIKSETRKHYEPVVLVLEIPWPVVQRNLNNPNLTYEQFTEFNGNLGGFGTIALVAPVPARYIVGTERTAQARGHLTGGRPVTQVAGRQAALKVMADGNSDYVMVALVPPPEAVKPLVDLEQTTEPADLMHLTLLYLGSTGEAGGSWGRERLYRACYDFALHSGHLGLTGQVNGFGTFYNPDEDGGVLWAAWDIPGINEFRASLKDYCERHGVHREDNHSFAPHMTLSYTDDQITTLPRLPDNLPDEVVFTDIWIAWGDSVWQPVRLA